MPTISPVTMIRRIRRANASEAARHSGVPEAAADSAGSHTNRANTSPPTTSAIAAYSSPRFTPAATSVTFPACWSCVSWETDRVGAGPPLPIENTKPPDTGCESAEMTW